MVKNIVYQVIMTFIIDGTRLFQVAATITEDSKEDPA